VNGDAEIGAVPPEAERAPNQQAYIELERRDATDRVIVRLSLQVYGPRPFTLLDCPEPAVTTLGANRTKVCFQQRNGTPWNVLPPESARAVGVTIEGPREIWIGIELFDPTPGDSAADYDRDALVDALRVVASLAADQQ